MAGRILIIDSVVNNRIMLRVKMLAAQFTVATCADCTSADRLIAAHRPDLILLNMGDPAAGALAFCAALRADPARRDIAIIALGLPDTARARLAALDAGADDAMARPVNDTLLLARIRSLLRARAIGDDLAPHDRADIPLGFGEAQAVFSRAGAIALIGPMDAQISRVARRLNPRLDQPVQWCDAAQVLRADSGAGVPDLVIIAACDRRSQADMMHLISDLHARLDTRLAAIMALVPAQETDLAALALDLGADDVVFTSASAAEISQRARRLVARKHHHDRLRRHLRDGLHAAMIDPLTGAFNRRYLDHHLPHLAAQSHHAGRALAVMMVDIDHFKAINDHYGHAAGDRVLAALAARLRAQLRAVDLLARIGGEEFLIAMPSATGSQAKAAADRIRRVISQTPFDLGEAFAPAQITVSVGLALATHKGAAGQDLAQICDRADAALYRAKTAGRDRVMVQSTAA